MRQGFLRKVTALAAAGGLFATAIALPATPVNALTISLVGQCPGGVGNVASLVAAINTANATPATSDTITLSAGCVYTLTAADHSGANGPTGLPSVVSPIIIQGNGATITRDGSAPDFRILENTGDLTLNNVTISGGRAGTGGGILSAGALTINDSTITNNAALVIGGGIRQTNASLSLLRTTLSGNTTIGLGGGIHVSDSNVQITRSSFLTNGAATLGGALYQDDGSLLIDTTTVSGNLGTLAGGVYLADIDEGVITGSTFSGNATAGLSISQSSLTVTNSTFSGNLGTGISSARSTLTVQYSTITGNNSTAITGGILTSRGTTTLLSSLVVDQANNPDCRQILSGTLIADAFNIDSDGSCNNATTSANVYLQPLALNAPGLVETHAIPMYSDAVGAADPGLCVVTDARTVLRNKDSEGCDVGAFEVEITYPDGMYVGQLKVKVNQQIVNLTDVQAQTTGLANELTEVFVTSAPGPQVNGAVYFDTLPSWKKPLKTAKETWTIQVQTPSVVTGAIFLNGDWRPFTATSKGTFKFLDGRFKLYFKIAGFIPTGTGSANAAFEIETLNGGFQPIPQ